MLLSIMKLLVTKLNSWLKSTLLCVPRVKSIQTFQKLIMFFPFCILYFIIMIFIIILYLKNDSVSRWIIWVSLFYLFSCHLCHYSYIQMYLFTSIILYFFNFFFVLVLLTLLLLLFYLYFISNISQVRIIWMHQINI